MKKIGNRDMTIDKRILEHNKFLEKLLLKEKVVESDLKNIRNKIMFHNTAIHNLRVKQHKN